MAKSLVGIIFGNPTMGVRRLGRPVLTDSAAGRGGEGAAVVLLSGGGAACSIVYGELGGGEGG